MLGRQDHARLCSCAGAQKPPAPVGAPLLPGTCVWRTQRLADTSGGEGETPAPPSPLRPWPPSAVRRWPAVRQRGRREERGVCRAHGLGPWGRRRVLGRDRPALVCSQGPGGRGHPRCRRRWGRKPSEVQELWGERSAQKPRAPPRPCSQGAHLPAEATPSPAGPRPHEPGPPPGPAGHCGRPLLR